MEMKIATLMYTVFLAYMIITPSLTSASK